MTLVSLTEDLESVINILKVKYNTSVKGKLSINPDNLNEVIFTVHVSTIPKLAPIEAEVVPEVKAVEVVNETQS